MEEELMNIDTQEVTEILVEETTEEITVEEGSITEIPTEEQIYDIDIVAEDPIIIDMSESMGWVSGDNRYHNSLLGIDYPNQHPITAISGLREELDKIEALKTVCSDKPSVANYYEWKDAAYDECGYFVSLVAGTSTIDVCNGTDILGVSVEDAGFVGGQDADVPRDNSYGLIVTSGLVDVRCELDIEVGDYVTSNAYGYATKSNSNYGYKVLARESKKGVEYAVIMLGVQADVIDALGAEVIDLDKRLDAAEANIVSAVNVANQAYNKSMEASQSTSVSEEAIKEALESILEAEKNIEEFEKVVESTSMTAAQAKAIAEGAVTSAASLKAEAVTRANDAWAKADQVATEAHSLCAKIDKYSVGEYSQAYGLTWEQAQGILEPGLIYVPTKHIDADSHTETYAYVDENGDEQQHERSFIPGFLYQWNYGWVTVDKNYNPADEVNESAKAVYFTSKEPIIAVGDNFGYWYTDADEITDKDGNVGTYEPYTLYKWETDHWLAVATLKGNASNRMVSEVYQTTNEIMMGVMNPRGGIAGFNAKLTDTESTTQQLAEWKNGGETSSAIIRQHAEDGNASIVIATVQETADGVEEMASLVLNASEDGTALVVSADNIDFEAENFTVDASHIDFTGDNFTIDADRINFEAENFTVDASHIDFTGDDFTINADRIDFEGSQITVSVADSIEIGGRNLLRNSSKVEISSLLENGTWDKWAGITFTPTMTPKKDENYVFSADVQLSIIAGSGVTTIPTDISVIFFDETYAYSSMHTLSISSQGHVSGVVVPNQDNLTLFSVYAGIAGDTAGLKAVFTNLQLEKGNKATDWTPAPEDLEAKLALGIGTDTDGKKYAYLNANADRIKFDATKTIEINAQNFTLTRDGEIMARKGTIGGCTIDEYGKLWIPAANISGTLTANSLVVKDSKNNTILNAGNHKVTISGWDFLSESIKYNGLNFGVENSYVLQPAGSSWSYKIADTETSGWKLGIGQNFGVAGNGNLYCKDANITGIINATSGEIGGFKINNSAIKVGVLGADNSVFLSPIDMQGAAGFFGDTYLNNWRLTIGSCFGVSSEGRLFAKNAYFDGGSISIVDNDDKRVELGSGGGLRVLDTIQLNGYYACAQYSANVLRYGRHTGSPDNIANTNVIEYNCYGSDAYILMSGTWSGSNSGSIVSDKNKKNHIEDLDSRYEVLFDNLTAKRFRYNDGTSNRYHTGYIAQDVQSAIMISELDEKEFAALCTFNKKEENEFMGLRYEEFVSLNTWQIQKAKSRIAKLEERVAQLEALIDKD